MHSEGKSYPHNAYKPTGVTLSAAYTIDDTTGQLLRIDPGGAARDVNLPTDLDDSNVGLWYEIVNTADAAENLVVKTGATTVVTISQNEKAKVVYLGDGNWTHMGIVGIALT